MSVNVWNVFLWLAGVGLSMLVLITIALIVAGVLIERRHRDFHR